MGRQPSSRRRQGAPLATSGALAHESQSLSSASAVHIILSRMLILASARRLLGLSRRKPGFGGQDAGLRSRAADTAYSNYRSAVGRWAVPAAAADQTAKDRSVAVARGVSSTLAATVERVGPAEKFDVATDLQILDDYVSAATKE
jgi:hypothetical protein